MPAPAASLPAGLALDPEWYVAHYADVAAAKVDPRSHWRDYGVREERLPRGEAAIVRRSGLFDENYYVMNNDDVRRAALAPLDHYCRYGIAEARRPNAYFDPALYHAAHGRPTHMGALAHYVLYGEVRGLRPGLLFDPAWYRATYGTAPGQALAHYLAHRRTQRFSPLPWFDVGWYVAENRAALRAGRDPFGHYLNASAASDVSPASWFDAALYRARRMPPGSRQRALLHLVRTTALGVPDQPAARDAPVRARRRRTRAA